MSNSVLKEGTRDFLYRDGGKFFMTRQYFASEVTYFRYIWNEVRLTNGSTNMEFYSEADAKEIMEELWEEMIENGNAYMK